MSPLGYIDKQTTKFWYRKVFLWKPTKINGRYYWFRKAIQKIKRSITYFDHGEPFGKGEAYMDKIIDYYLTEEEAFLSEL